MSGIKQTDNSSQPFGKTHKNRNSAMKQYKLYWLDGKTEFVEGFSIDDAFARTGYGRGALLALDYWEEIK